MRRPVFVQMLELAQNLGLNAVLRGRALPQDVVVRTGIPNLDAIAAGVATANSTELLLGRGMDGLLAWARSYDFVLIDSPPASLLMDACILARQVDWVLCCLRRDRVQASGVDDTLRMLKGAGSAPMGIVLTMARSSVRLAHDARPAMARRTITEEAA